MNWRNLTTEEERDPVIREYRKHIPEIQATRKRNKMNWLKQNFWLSWWAIIVLTICALLIFSGCGGELQWVPHGDPSPIGGKPIITAILDGATEADSRIGGLIQILAGAVGCGGAVAVGRRFLRNRAQRRQQAMALNEIVGGVQAFIDKKFPGEAITAAQNSLTGILKSSTTVETQDLVRTIKRKVTNDTPISDKK